MCAEKMLLHFCLPISRRCLMCDTWMTEMHWNTCTLAGQLMHHGKKQKQKIKLKTKNNSKWTNIRHTEMDASTSMLTCKWCWSADCMSRYDYSYFAVRAISQVHQMEIAFMVKRTTAKERPVISFFFFFLYCYFYFYFFLLLLLLTSGYTHFIVKEHMRLHKSESIM